MADVHSTRTERSLAFERLLATAFRNLLSLDDDARVRLERLAGRRLEVRLREREWRIHAILHDGGFHLDRACEGRPDVSISGRVADFVALVRANKRGESIAAGRIEITGDLAIAQDVQAVLGQLELDVEELLSRYVGDIAAHQIGRAMRAASHTAAGTLARLERDLGEYVRDEVRATPARQEIAALGRDIFSISDDVERAEARLRRLVRGTHK